MRSDDIRCDSRYGLNNPYFGMPKGHLPVVSYLAVPVISRSGDVLGGLFFGHKEVGVFGEEIEELVSAIAAHAAIAIDNSALFERAQREAAASFAPESPYLSCLLTPALAALLALLSIVRQRPVARRARQMAQIERAPIHALQTIHSSLVVDYVAWLGARSSRPCCVQPASEGLARRHPAGRSLTGTFPKTAD